MLRNFAHIIHKYQSIPIEVFLEPFVKQVKIRESKSYFLNIFDMEFILVLVNHRRLRPDIALELFDLLAKTKLNNFEFAPLADRAMQTLLDRFLEEDIFFEYVQLSPRRLPSLSRSASPSFTPRSRNAEENGPKPTRNASRPRREQKSST
jgi:hypothetical protein